MSVNPRMKSAWVPWRHHWFLKIYWKNLRNLRAYSQKNDERIEKTNRCKAAKLELDSLSSEKDMAVAFIKQERELMLLNNMLHFIELGDSVK